MNRIAENVRFASRYPELIALCRKYSDLPTGYRTEGTLVQDGADAVFDFGDGNSITLVGVDQATLTDDNVIL